MKTNQKENDSWIEIALEAFNIAFESHGSIKKDIGEDIRNEAIKLFYDSISLGANEAWPYIKLAELIDENKEKIKLYTRAWRAEENPYSSVFLLKTVLQDHPTILDKYL